MDQTPPSAYARAAAYNADRNSEEALDRIDQLEKELVNTKDRLRELERNVIHLINAARK